jgi:hypothetical protein
MQKLVIFGLIGLISWSSCKKENSSATTISNSDTKKQAAESLFGDFNPPAELRALQGKWKVRDTNSDEPSTWTIDDNVLVRQTDDGINRGTIEIVSPGMIACVIHEGDGTMREYFSYARNGTDIYIGTGISGAKLSDRYVVADQGVLVKIGSSCKYYEKSEIAAGFESKGIDVMCVHKEENGKQMLAYRLPNSSKDDPNSMKTVQVIGTALLDEKMRESQATKVVDSNTPEYP